MFVMVTTVIIQLDQYISCDLKFSPFTEKLGFYISFVFSFSTLYVCYSDIGLHYITELFVLHLPVPEIEERNH